MKKTLIYIILVIFTFAFYSCKKNNNELKIDLTNVRTVFALEEDYNKEGLKVTLNNEEINDYEIDYSDYDKEKPGKYEIFIKKDDYTNSYEVEVIDKKITFEISRVNKIFSYNEDYNNINMRIYEFDADNKRTEIKDYILDSSAYKKDKPGKYKILVKVDKLEFSYFVEVLPEITNYDFGGFSVTGVGQRNIDNTHKDYYIASNEIEFLDAIENKAKVIEVTNDLDLGFISVSNKTTKTYSFFKNYLKNKTNFVHPTLVETGVSQIELSWFNGLTIFSKNGNTIKHAGFKITRSNDVVFRNLKFDELWQWEDSETALSGISDYDMQSWSYFKIGFSKNIWFDHLTFGKAYDALADLENAPEDGVSSGSLTISNSRFEAGFINNESFYKTQMEYLEDQYQKNTLNLLYYKKLRDAGITYKEIYDFFISQKKGFMIGGGGNDKNSPEYIANKRLAITIYNTYFKSLQDRLPRIRGGNAHIYNVYSDSSLLEIAIKNLTSNPNFSQAVLGAKLALVNQAIIHTNEGAVLAENSIFEGVNTLYKDQGGIPGRYKITNSIHIKNNNSNTINTSSTDFYLSNNLSEIPYQYQLIELTNLKEYLISNTGLGVKQIDWLKDTN